MTPDIKFCGLTRPEDAAEARDAGGRYAGVILAPSARRLLPESARRVLAAAGGLRRVGVFGHALAPEIAELAQTLGLDVVQLHGDPDGSLVDDVRSRFPGEVWAVVRVEGDRLPASAARLAALADAIVLDARAEGQLGGTGTRFDWEGVAASVDGWRGATRLVLAGGLTPHNVWRATSVLAPDVVDVSSGVESAPGIKDHEKMRAFARAAGGRTA